MKDYANKNRSNRATLKPRVNTAVKKPFNADRLLIAFIVCALALAALSAGHTAYQKWQQKQTALSSETTIPASLPIKTALEKASHESDDHKTVLADNTSLPKHIEKTLKKKAKTIETKEATTVANNEPKYDFYQILPKMTVDIAKGDDTDHHTS